MFFLFLQELAKTGKSVRASSQPKSEAVESVMQNANVSRSAAVQALLENFNEPLTAVIVRQP
jgi:hypothetical protein